MIVRHPQTEVRFSGDRVQTIRDDIRRTDRVVREVGHCVTCNRSTWSFDDGQNDPRGALGDHAASPLVAEEYDMTGADVPQCFPCANDYVHYTEGLHRAIAGWAS